MLVKTWNDAWEWGLEHSVTPATFRSDSYHKCKKRKMPQEEGTSIFQAPERNCKNVDGTETETTKSIHTSESAYWYPTEGNSPAHKASSCPACKLGKYVSPRFSCVSAPFTPFAWAAFCHEQRVCTVRKTAR